MLSLNDRKIRSILIAVFLCVTSTVSSGEERSDSQLLRRIADGYEKNSSRLRTWTGNAVREYEKSGTLQWSERLYFIADRDQKSYLWRGIRTLGAEGRKNLTNKNLIKELNSGMSKGGFTYKMMDFWLDPSGKFVELPRGTLTIYDEKAFPKGMLTPSFEPVWILISEVSLDGQLGNMLRGIAKGMEDNLVPEDAYQIIREGSKVKIILYDCTVNGKRPVCCCSPNRDCETASSNADKIVQFDKKHFDAYVFDTKKGYSLVETHDLDYDYESRKVIDYEKHNGVFVLNKMTTKYVSKKHNLMGTLKITTKSVNEKIPSSEFQYEKLGLRPGDDIADHSAGGRRSKWESPDNVDHVVKAVWDSIIHNVGEPVTSKNENGQTPEMDVKATTSPAAK
ncbi:MAG: hypothetical protein JW849_09765 [Phycisphaerae bacterium]|nr:hypothetical protein [Phycisphaerae bacterium]